MLFRVLTIFPEMIADYCKIGVLGRAQKKKIITIEGHDLRAWTDDAHKSVDDTPYGGGAGMVMKIEPIYKALRDLKKSRTFRKGKQKIILLSARGRTWNQSLAREYARDLQSMVFICGRYEGIDDRVLELVDEEISIGDYVLTGGELGAAVIIDSVARLLPGVLGNSDSLSFESHSVEGVLEYPQYTKPEAVRFGNKTHRVPSVLLSGNHKAIAQWREAHFAKKPKAIKRRSLR